MYCTHRSLGHRGEGTTHTHARARAHVRTRIRTLERTHKPQHHTYPIHPLDMPSTSSSISAPSSSGSHIRDTRSPAAGSCDSANVLTAPITFMYTESIMVLCRWWLLWLQAPEVQLAARHTYCFDPCHLNHTRIFPVQSCALFNMIVCTQTEHHRNFRFVSVNISTKVIEQTLIDAFALISCTCALTTRSQTDFHDTC